MFITAFTSRIYLLFLASRSIEGVAGRLAASVECASDDGCSVPVGGGVGTEDEAVGSVERGGLREVIKGGGLF